MYELQTGSSFHIIIFMAIFLPQSIIKLPIFFKNTWTELFKYLWIII